MDSTYTHAQYSIHQCSSGSLVVNILHQCVLQTQALLVTNAPSYALCGFLKMQRSWVWISLAAKPFCSITQVIYSSLLDFVVQRDARIAPRNWFRFAACEAHRVVTCIISRMIRERGHLLQLRSRRYNSISGYNSYLCPLLLLKRIEL